MVEKYELRLHAEYAHLLADLIKEPPELTSSSLNVILRGVVGDPVFARVKELDRKLREAGRAGVFAGWDIRRTFSREEIERAELFLLRIGFTHVAGEEYGTEYEESSDCLQQAWRHEFLDHSGAKFRTVPEMVPCGICSKRVGVLQVPFSKLAKKRDLFRIWGGELIVSERLAALLREGGFTGGELLPVRNIRPESTRPMDLSVCPAGVELLSLAAAKGVNLNPKKQEFWWWLYEDAPKALLNEMLEQQKALRIKPARSSRSYSQLVLHSRPLEVSERTRFGDRLLDTDVRKVHCKSGEIAGGSLLSPLSVVGDSWDGSDLCRTRVYIIRRQGLFRPHQPLVVSKRLFTAMQQSGMKGFRYEVAETT